MGVEILPGVAGNELLTEDGAIIGVRTGDIGFAKDGSMKDSFEPGIDILAKQTIFAEGCRGSLTERIKK